MSTKFWGHRMAPGDELVIDHPGILQLSQIALADSSVDGKTVLKVEAKGFTFVLCTLSKNKVEFQKLTHFFIKEDKATLILTGSNSVNIVGTLIQYGPDEIEMEGDNGDDDDDYDERETITGQPQYANYLSDLLGPDLPDDDDDDFEDDMDMDQDDFGTMAFRDPNDNEFLGGFELRHFNLAPNVPGFEPVDLRAQEQDMEESMLNDNIAKGLVNALLNSGDDFQIKKGKEMLKKLKKQSKQRKD